MKGKIYSLSLTLLGILLLVPLVSPGDSVSSIEVVPNQLEIAQQASRYRVRVGDTISGIAAKHRVSVGQLLQWNPHLRRNPNLIRVGQTIYLRRTASVDSDSRRVSKSPRSYRAAFRNLRLPSERRTAGHRLAARRGLGDICLKKDSSPLKAILPNTNFGYTLQDYPTFFWYQPSLIDSAIPVKFSLRKIQRSGEEEAIGAVIYSANLEKLSPGIVQFTLPPDAPPLVEGKEYEWEVTLECTDLDWSFVKGRIKRLSTDSAELSSKLENAEIEDYPSIYAEEGIWYDALAMVAALRQEEPDNPALVEDWTNLLSNIGFESIASAPILNSQP